MGTTDLAIIVGVYLATAFGITIGYHRLLTHRAFETYRPLKYLFAILGSMAVQGPVIDWVADHRKHHAHTDEEGDPHSPHVGHGSGLRGLWHAHVGWLLESNGIADAKKYAPDLLEDAGMRFISRYFLSWVGCWAWRSRSGWASRSPARWPAACRPCSGAAWCGCSSCTTSPGASTPSATSSAAAASRPTTCRPTSSGSPLPSLGEAWHHNHHAFPRAAVQGLRWCEIDMSGLVIRAMKRLRLAWNVVQITPERQHQRLAAGKRRLGARSSTTTGISRSVFFWYSS